MNNQYNSLPHTTGNIGTGTQRGPFFNNGINNNPNANPNARNKKSYKSKNARNNFNNKNNSVNNNMNTNLNKQPYNNYNNFGPDYVGCSLPHTQTNGYSNNRNNMSYKFKFDLNNFGNNVTVPPTGTINNNNNGKKYNKKRGGNNNSNYNNYGTGSFVDSITERLNKSLTKEPSLDNSFGEINTMPTSHSLDNLQYHSVNIKLNSPSKMTNSYSFANTSPSRGTQLHHYVDTIHELEVTENFQSNYMNTNLSNNIDSGVDSNSFCSMPLGQMEAINYSNQNSYVSLTASALSSIENVEQHITIKAIQAPSISESSSSFSSPDSQNQNDYETGESQLLVTASEGELSFGYDSMIPNVAENVINNFQIETNYENELKKAVLENTINDMKSSELAEKADDTTTSISSSSSISGSIQELDQLDTLTTPNTVNENTLLDEQEKQLDTPLIQNGATSAFSIGEKEDDCLANESETEIKQTVCTNLISNATKEEKLSALNDTKLQIVKFEEEEINNLVNKIVLDVIAQALLVTPELTVNNDVVKSTISLNTQSDNQGEEALKEEVEVEAVPVEVEAVPVEIEAIPVEIKAIPVEVEAVPVEVEAVPVEVEAVPVEVEAVSEAEIFPVEVEISFDEKFDTVLYNPAVTEITDKLNSSLQIIEHSEINDAKNEVDETNEILNKTEEILSTSISLPAQSKSNKQITQKEPPVDCFSCTIS